MCPHLGSSIQHPVSNFRIHAIANVAHAWLEPSSSWMREAQRKIPTHSPYSKEMVGACLKSAFENYTVDILKQWLKQDLPTRTSIIHSSNKALIILPSTVFAAGWQAATAAWLAGASVVLKPSQKEPFFCQILQKSVRAIAGNILPIEIVKPKGSRENAPSHISFEREFFTAKDVSNDDPSTFKIEDFTAIIAYGKDSTIQYLQSSPNMRRRLVGFGSKLSLGYITQKGLWEKNSTNLINRAAWDTVLYETQGCLSPHCFYVKEEGTLSAKIFAEKLAKKIRAFNKSLPQKKSPHQDLEEESFWQRWRFRESQGQAQIFDRSVILHQEAFEPCGLRRVVFVSPIRRMSDFLKRCGEWLTRFSTISLSDLSQEAEFKLLTKNYRGIRFCEIGKMHEPIPGWHNGGINLLKKLSIL